jgi:hypothetical protein
VQSARPQQQQSYAIGISSRYRVQSDLQHWIGVRSSLDVRAKCQFLVGVSWLCKAHLKERCTKIKDESARLIGSGCQGKGTRAAFPEPVHPCDSRRGQECDIYIRDRICGLVDYAPSEMPWIRRQHVAFLQGVQKTEVNQTAKGQGSRGECGYGLRAHNAPQQRPRATGVKCKQSGIAGSTACGC